MCLSLPSSDFRWEGICRFTESLRLEKTSKNHWFQPHVFIISCLATCADQNPGMNQISRGLLNAAASLGVWICVLMWAQALLPLSPGESCGRAGRNELPLLPACLIILQLQSRRAGSISAPVEVGGGVFPAKLFSPCYPFPIASPCHVWGLGFCIFC